jgi:hypothetical protein
MAKMKISRTPSGNTGTGTTRTDQFISPAPVKSISTTDYPGAVGGVYTQAGPQIHVQCFVKGAAQAEGGILLAKGGHKFYVQDAAGNKGQCTLVNKAKGSLVAGEMSITVTKADSSTFYASKITNKFVWDFSSTPKKYRYWHNSTSTTNNTYVVDYATGVTGFVSIPDAA